MTATTPHLKGADRLGPLASRYVEVEGLPWKPTPCPGIDMKVLLEDAESGLLTEDVRRIEQEACDAVKDLMHPRYVKPGGVDEDTFNAYFRVVATCVFAEYWDANNRESLFALLAAQISGLSESAYRTNHRNTVEYLLKLVRKRTKAALAKAFD